MFIVIHPIIRFQFPHNDRNIPITKKFHYSKGTITGDASNIIASSETTSKNYIKAWELLKNRYHNKKVMIDTHVKALYNLKPVAKECSIRQWNCMLIHLIKSKSNNDTIEKWPGATY